MLPIIPIVEAISALATTAGFWVTKQKADKTEEKNRDLAKEVSELQVELQKQTAFIASLTQQLQALAVQVQKQDAVIVQLRGLTFLSLALSVLLFASVLWIELHR